MKQKLEFVKRITSNLGVSNKDSASGGRTITRNIKTALDKPDSPFKKRDYKNPFIKED